MRVECRRCGADMEEPLTTFANGRFFCKGKKACTERLRVAIADSPARVISGRKVDRVEVAEENGEQELRIHLEGGVRVDAGLWRSDPDSAELRWAVVPE